MRFTWSHRRLLAEGSGTAGKDTDPHVVIDTQPPGGEPGQACHIGVFPNKAAAIMAAMALNGVAPVKDSAN
jgi:hypothetical protein